MTRLSTHALRIFQCGKSLAASCGLLLLILLMPALAVAATNVDLSVSSYVWSPDPAIRGGSSAFTVVVTNNDPGVAAANLTLAIQLPANIDYGTAATTTPAGCVFDLSANPKLLTCSRANLATMATWSVSFAGVGLTSGTQNTTATVSALDNNDPNNGNDSLLKPTTVINGADLSVSKSGPASAAAGSTISFAIRVSNAGPDPAASFRVTDNLPATTDFTYSSASGSGWSCSRVLTTVTCDYSGTEIPSGGSAPDITLTGRVTTATGSITNGASVAGTDGLTGDPVSGNNGPSQVVVTVDPATDIRANKTMVSATTGMTTYAEGESVTLTLSATNQGPQNATGVTIADVVSSDFSIGSLPGACSAVGQSITCTVGALNNGATSGSFVIPLTVVGTGGSSGSNTANVSRTTPTGGANTAASVYYSIAVPYAHLTIAKSKSPNPVAAGANITNGITVTNSSASTSAATGTIRVTDALDANEFFVSYSGSGWSCSGANVGETGTVTCDYAGANLARGSSLPLLTITTQAAPGYLGSITNTACTGQSAESPHIPSDNSSTGNCQSRTVIGTSRNVDISVTKSVSTAHAQISDSSYYYTLTIANAGPDVAPTVSVSDALNAWYNGDAGTTGGSAVITSAAAGESCSFGSTVHCTLLNVTNGSPRTITITLDRPFKDGTINNTATISTPDAIDTVPGNNSHSVSILIDPLADVTVTSIAAAPDPVKVGVQLTFTTSIKNLGPSTAGGVLLRHVIDPTLVSYVTGTASLTVGGSCSYVSSFSGSPYAGQAGIECSGFSLSNGEARQLTFKVIPNYPYPGGIPGSYSSSAYINTTTPETDSPGYGNNTLSKAVSVIVDALDLLVTDNDPGYDPTAFGDSIIYQIKVQNNGPSQATGFTLTVTPTVPPQGTAPDPYTMTYNAAGSTLPAGAACGLSGSDLVCYLGAGVGSSYLAPNTSRTFNLKFDTGPLTNVPSGSLTYKTVATVSSNESLAAHDSLPGNNSVTETTTVLPKTDLLVVSKTVSKSTVDINEPFTYTITVGNKGPSDVAGMKMTDAIPAGFVITGVVTVTPGASVSLTTNNCPPLAVGTNGTVTCTLGPLPTDATGADATKQVTITIPVRAAYQSTGTYSFSFNTNIANTATAAVLPGISLDPDNTNDSKTVNVQVRRNSIAGTVYTDNNQNGAIDANEGINSVTLTLTGTDSYGKTYQSSGTYPAITTTTAASGNTGLFTFNSLPPGTWTIVETQPASYYDGLETAGSAGGTPPAATCDGTNNCTSSAAHNTISSISLPADTATAATSYIFQEYRRGSINGYVYHDANNNGDRVAGETGISGQGITLSGTAYNGSSLCSMVTCATTTNASGYFAYSTLPPSDSTGYAVMHNSQPATYLPGKSQNGDGVANVVAGSAGVPSPKSITGIVLAPNATASERNFGELIAATISGYVFLDADANAARGAGETTGMTGISISLSGTDDLGAAVGPTTATTAANGSYSFTGLRPGTYALTETPPAGVTHTGAQAGAYGGDIAGSTRTSGTGVPGIGNVSITNIPIASNNSGTGYNFGESGQGLSGYVYLDSNISSVMDAGDSGIPGVQVTLSGHTSAGADVCAAISPNPCTVTTNSSGLFTYTTLPASDGTGYTIAEQSQAASPLTNYADGTDNIGTVGGSGRGSSAVKNSFSGITVAVGESGINYNFGELGAKLSGTIYHDANNDGSKGVGENGISGVTVTIAGTSISGSAVNRSATTDGSGNFTLTDILAANGSGYALTITQPVNYADGKKSAGTSGGTAGTPGTRTITTISLAGGVNATGYYFGETLGSLSGTVYYDANNDGSKSGASETGLGGITVTLSGIDLATGASVNRTASTDSNGVYAFSDLPASGAGGYTLTVTQPANYADGKKTAGTSGGAASSPGVRTITGIAFSAGAAATGYFFGETLGGLSGTVYYDANNDGSKSGASETGINGVTITLSGLAASGVNVCSLATCTAVTNSSGGFSFSELPGADGSGYTLTITQPANYADGKKTAGTSGGTASSPGTRTITGIAFASGANATGYFFGETLGSLTGTIYYDANNDGSKSGAAETGISGVAIALSGIDVATGAAVNKAATTDGSGNYAFSDLPASGAGGYTLTVTQPVNYADGKKAAGTSGGTTGSPGVSTITGIAFTPGTAATGYFFGETLGNLSGTVYYDTNNNGAKDTGEPGISGVGLILSGTDASGSAVSKTGTTDSSGNYTISDVPASNGSGFSLTESQPVIYADGQETAGSLGGTPGAPGTSIISTIMFPAGTAGTGYLFGERLGGLMGIVYIDASNNGVRDAGEAGIANVTISLTGTDAGGASLSRTTTTAFDGTYSFADVPASNGSGYILTETQPASYLDGIETPGMLGGSVGAPGTSVISAISYPADSNATGYLFGEIAGGLSGSVYHDANNNGSKDSGEAGIFGITVTLTGTDVLGTAVSHSTSTAPDGSYSFSDLAAANATGYTLTETQPANYLDGRETAGTLSGTVDNGSFTALPAQNTISAIPFTAGATATGYIFGERLGSLSGSVYHDANNNGVKDTGEAGVAGVTLTLTGTEAGGTAVNRSTTTAADGSYSFTDLATANGLGYTLTETQPVNYLDGRETAGALGGTADNGSFTALPAQNTISAIPFAAGASGTDYIFGERLGSLSGSVYYDVNNNGVKDSGETGVAGVILTLTGTDASGTAVNRSDATAADGSYSFGNLAAANGSGYTLTETQPVNYLDGRETTGALGGTVDNGSFTALPAQNAISAIPFAAGAVGTDYIFGERLGSLSGSVYSDVNSNGSKDSGEAGIPAITITLTGTDASGAAVNRSTTTAVDGSYSFADLPAANGSGYAITETQPIQYLDGRETTGSLGGTIDNGSFTALPAQNTISAIPFAAGSIGTEYIFGEQPGSLSGIVYYDANGNGSRDSGEPGIAGVAITLAGTDASGAAVSRSATTAADGSYTFSDLPASNNAGYTLTETQPVNYSEGTIAAGSSGGTVGSNTVTAIIFSAGAAATNYLFGETEGNLSGAVYYDANNNGSEDSGETGIAGITITLTGTDASGVAVNRSVTTAADGTYSFADMPASNGSGYALTETQPVNYLDGKETAGSLGGTVDNGSFTALPAQNTIAAIPFAAGANGTGYIFGERLGSLSGTVYYDANNNGSKDTSETGIAGVLFALTGTDASGAAINRAATTAADGSYSFADLAASNGAGYMLAETQPIGYSDGVISPGTAGGTAGANSVTAILFSAGTVATNYLFGETAGGLSGAVYYDANSNGLRDAGEIGIADIAVTLTGTDAGGAVVNRIATTAADGSYSFADLLAANSSGYTLTETHPINYLDGMETAGSLGGAVDNAIFTALAPQNTISAIPFAAGANGTGYLFGERLGSLSGFVYYDTNNNGGKDSGEAGIGGVLLTLTGTDASGAAVNRTAPTAADGSYSFAGLPAANASGYSIIETHPANYLDAKETAGTLGGSVNNGSFNAMPAQNTISAIPFAAGANGAGYLFGEQLGSLAGAVYYDVNNNGSRDSGEAGIAGVLLTLAGIDASGAVVNRSATTASDGSYFFADLAASNGAAYSVIETQPANYLDGKETAGSSGGTVNNLSFTAMPAQNTISAISFTAGTHSTDYIFGEQLGSLSGLVYHDTNNSGAKDNGEEGIPGVAITLTGTDASGAAVSRSTTTAADGTYSFADLPASNGTGYTLRETQPANYSEGIISPGSVGGTTGINTVTAIHFPAGAIATNYLFGERLGGLSGSVYIDANNNGIREAGEIGIANASVTLAGTDASGSAVTRSTSTASEGSYSFADLPRSNASGYSLTETQPAGYLDGKLSKGLVNGVPCVDCDITVHNRIAAISYDAAKTFTSFNFGELQSSRLSGTVYRDNNGDGKRDEEEPGLPGVFIALSGVDDRGVTVTITATTNAEGAYSIDNLRPSGAGGYKLTETQPTAYGDLAGASGTKVGTIGETVTGTAGLNAISDIVLNSGNSGTGYDFGDIAGGLRGTVYVDSSANGAIDAGEPGIAGVVVSLTGTDVNGALVNLSTVTAGDGTFAFNLLLGGVYTLTETQPIIYADGKETAGTAGGVVDNGSFTFNPAQNRIGAITLVSGMAAGGYLFGEQPGVKATVSGTIWFNNISIDTTQQQGEPGIAGWIVQAVQGGVVRGTATAASDGTYQITDLPPATGYELRFLNPGSGALFGDPASQDPNYHDSIIDLSRHTIGNLTLRSGANVIHQDLPVDPSGVVYNSVTRQPVTGATVALSGPAGFDPATHLAGGTANQAQTTDATGFYQFLLLPDAPEGNYLITVTEPPGYTPGISSMIPPAAGPFNPGPGPGVVAIQNQSTPPTVSQSTQYYVSLVLGGGTAAIINNHLPVDPVISGAIVVQKTTPMVNVAKGDLVPYTVTVTNTLSTRLTNIDIHDRIPPGFKYRENSTTLNGESAPPVVAGRDLAWRNLTFTAGERKIFKMILVVGAGVGEGKYTNEAWAVNNIVNTDVSNRATATVRVVPDHTFDCTDVIGKVFDDRNANGYQDEEEPGLPNIRVVTARGLLVTSDSMGRFHVPCATVPDPDRGSNFIMKLDERTLPSGYRLTTENPLAVRATRGKMAKLNFGASLLRVVRVDLTDAAFESGKDSLLPQWLAKIENLDKTLQEKPSLLRIGYVRGREPSKLAKDRVGFVEKVLRERWKKHRHQYELAIEVEIEEVRQ